MGKRGPSLLSPCFSLRAAHQVVSDGKRQERREKEAERCTCTGTVIDGLLILWPFQRYHKMWFHFLAFFLIRPWCWWWHEFFFFSLELTWSRLLVLFSWWLATLSVCPCYPRLSLHVSVLSLSPTGRIRDELTPAHIISYRSTGFIHCISCSQTCSNSHSAQLRYNFPSAIASFRFLGKGVMQEVLKPLTGISLANSACGKPSHILPGTW